MTFNIDAPRVIVMKQARGGLHTVMLSVCHRGPADPRLPATESQAGLIETEPTSDLVVIAYGELADRRTVIVDVPTNVCVLILYAIALGTVRVIAPRLVDAFRDRGGTEHVAMIPPALDFRLTSAERRSTAVISPAPVCAVTDPESDVSVIAPVSAETRTATPRGTSTV